MKAVLNAITIAESDDTVIIENNHYFPASSVKTKYISKNGESYACSWKGECEYYDVTVGDKVVQGGAWMYPEPHDAAREIAGHFAFWRGVEVVD